MMQRCCGKEVARSSRKQATSIVLESERGKGGRMKRLRVSFLVVLLMFFAIAITAGIGSTAPGDLTAATAIIDSGGPAAILNVNYEEEATKTTANAIAATSTVIDQGGVATAARNAASTPATIIVEDGAQEARVTRYLWRT